MSDYTEETTTNKAKKSADTQDTPAVNRKYKDALFRKIFEKKEDLLSLYNAVNNSHYEDPGQLEVTTIDDVLYLGMKNDVSFLIDQYMNLYEHQSTRNPNMPLRGLFYFSRLYQAYTKKYAFDLFDEELILLPTPNYIVFYNGKKEEPDRQELRLSRSYMHHVEAPFSLECVATVLNINVDHNLNLMKQCEQLHGYAYFVNQVRDLRESGMDLKMAINQATDDCIQKDYLREFLLKHRAEVRDMLLCENDYLEKLHMDNVKKKLKVQQDELEQRAEAMKQQGEAMKQRAEAMEQQGEAMKQRAEAMRQQDEAMKQRAEAMEQEKVSMEQEKVSMEQEKVSMEQEKVSMEREKSVLEQQREAAERRVIGWVCRRMRQNLSAAEIAEDIEEPLEHVALIMQAAEKAAPDYDPEKIYRALEQE